MQTHDLHCFLPAAGTGEIEINPDSDGTDELVLEQFKCVGKIIAKAIYDRQNLVLSRDQCCNSCANHTRSSTLLNRCVKGCL